MKSINNYLLVKREEVEEKRSAGGIIIASAFHETEQFTKRNICTAKVMYDNPYIPFVKAGDRIALNPEKGNRVPIDYEHYTVITAEQFIAKIESDGKYIVPPDSIMVKMKKEDRDALFSRWVIKNDGTKVQLFLQSEPEEHSDQRSQVFVSIGEISQVGENIKDVEPGDTAILDYTVDNFLDNILYHDDEGNKYVVIDGITTYHQNDYWIYANRRNAKDTLVYSKNDMNITSPLLGVIRNEKLISRQPYVFLEHRSNVVERRSNSGIAYSETQEIVERKVLSVSSKSKNDYGLQQGQTILVRDADIFDVQLAKYKIQCILDSDVLMGE